MHTPTRHCLMLLAPGLLAAGVVAQQTKPSPLLPRKAPPSRTISLDVVVASKSGEPVSGLQQKDFTILDNGEPQTITSFRAFDGEEEPVEVVLLIDTINVSFQTVASERIGIDKFLRAYHGHLTSPTALAILSNAGVQVQGGYTRDGYALANWLDAYTISLRTIGPSAGGAGAAERLQDSLKALKVLATYEAAQPGHKMILWISPGWPLLVGPGVDLTYKQQEGIFNEITWVSAQLRESRTTMYSVNPMGANESPAETTLYEQYLKGVAKPAEDSYGNLAVQVIATQTGGLVLDSGDVSYPLERCVADAGAYYRISFEPPPFEHRDVYRSLKIKLAGPGLTARTSTGYYGEP